MLTRRDGTRIKEWFWSDEMVERLEGKDGCWLWRAPIAADGYGRFGCSTYGEGGRKTYPAHKVSWELATGEKVRTGLLVCHHCDNRRCIRPSHLFVGTHTDNMRDMWAKGRGWNHKPPVMRGENSMQSRVSAAQVIEFRRLFLTGISCRELAKQFNLGHCLVSNAVSGRSWAHIPGAVTDARSIYLRGELFKERRAANCSRMRDIRYRKLVQTIQQSK